MITVTITRKDGSVYWVEHFNTIKDANEWMTAEKRQPYWQKDFKVSVDDKTAEIEAARKEFERLEAEKLAARKAKRDAVKAAIAAKPKTVADAIAIIEKLVDALDF